MWIPLLNVICACPGDVRHTKLCIVHDSRSLRTGARTNHDQLYSSVALVAIAKKTEV